MSTYYSHTYFLDGKLHVRGNTVLHPTLYVEPESQYGPGCAAFQIDSELSTAEQAEIAERFAQGVTTWAAEVRARADAERTAADEPTEARAEIARLQGETGGAA